MKRNSKVGKYFQTKKVCAPIWRFLDWVLTPEGTAGWGRTVSWVLTKWFCLCGCETSDGGEMWPESDDPDDDFAQQPKPDLSGPSVWTRDLLEPEAGNAPVLIEWHIDAEGRVQYFSP